MLPPVGWADVATKTDLRALERNLEIRFEAVDATHTALARAWRSGVQLASGPRRGRAKHDSAPEA